MGCSEVDPVSGVMCLDTSGLEHAKHYGVGFDGDGSWGVSWYDAEEIRRLLALRRDDDYSPAGLERDQDIEDGNDGVTVQGGRL